MIQVLPLEKIRENVGREMGVSDWVVIDQDRINRFADCTGDHQWIHVDEEAAAKGPFGRTIAHGYLVLSLLSMFGADHGMVPEGTVMAINYGLNKVRFINPVPVDSRIRDHMVLAAIEEKEGDRVLFTTNHTIELEGADKPACVAESLAMFFLG
ncbi:MAG: MaoC family dehydratase [Desulfatibacillaceae bacterium]